MIKALDKCFLIYTRSGALALLRKLIIKLCNIIYNTNSATWYVRPLNSEGLEIIPEIPLTADFVSFNETLNWIKQQNIPWMLNENEIKVAKRIGHHWASIRYNGNIIGYIKLGFNEVFITDYKKIIKFPKHVAYIYDTFVLDEFRNRKVASYFIRETCKFLKKKGFGKVICHIPDWNISSIKVYSKAGFKRIQAIRFLNILGFKILTKNPSNF
ncbi:MAG TPA: GNAT family N-acetyltransferase [Desulfatiglandales bacterium]|nr:GNAT family N-acetyltransferase [Desulfatiglandales bacterium]